MSDEVMVTIVVLLRDSSSGLYEQKEFKNVSVNTRAPSRQILLAILANLSKKGIKLDDADMMVQAPDGSPLSNVNIVNGSRILIMPKDTGNLVNFG